MRYPIKLVLAAPWPGEPRTQRKTNEGDNSLINTGVKQFVVREMYRSMCPSSVLAVWA
jgi:hypothetical protein